MVKPLGVSVKQAPPCVQLDGMPDEAIRRRDLRLGGSAHIIASLQENGEGPFNYQPYIDNIFHEIATARISFLGDREEDDMTMIARALHYMDTDELCEEVLAWGFASQPLLT
jgi:hypothetical protein